MGYIHIRRFPGECLPSHWVPGLYTGTLLYGQERICETFQFSLLQIYGSFTYVLFVSKTLRGLGWNRALFLSVPHLGWAQNDEAIKSFQMKVKRSVVTWGKFQAGSQKAWSFMDLLFDLEPDMASASLPPSAQGE